MGTRNIEKSLCFSLLLFSSIVVFVRVHVSVQKVKQIKVELEAAVGAQLFDLDGLRQCRCVSTGDAVLEKDGDGLEVVAL